MAPASPPSQPRFWAPGPPAAPAHVARHGARGLLYRTVGHAWPRLRRAAGERGGSWPFFVQREFDRYLRCGCLEHGFLRVYCHHCKLDRLVPFSCKGRGFCPSCGARRMAVAAAHLADHVIPRVPTRQWVLSLPVGLRYRLAFDSSLCGKVRGLFASAVIAQLRRRAAKQASAPSIAGWAGGAATWTQRFGDGLRLNIHFHAIVLDGAFAPECGGPPRFSPASEPTAQDLAHVATRVIRGLRRLLLDDDDASAALPAYLTDDPTLAACLAAASRDKTALNAAESAHVSRLQGGTTARPLGEDSGCRWVAGGFNLHAGARIGANDRKRLERLCRYVGRPALSEARLEQAHDGRVIFHLKRSWSDGTRALMLTPLQLTERLALMVPPPRAHLVTYHGVLSSHSALRSRVAPSQQAESGPRQSGPLPEPDSAGLPSATVPARRQNTMSWAALLQRVFLVDALRCPRCGHRSEIIATICDGRVIAAFLEVWKPSPDPP